MIALSFFGAAYGNEPAREPIHAFLGGGDLAQ